MAGFGTSVLALLETYTKCLHLLKAFEGHRNSDTESDVSEVHSRLRSSIRSDRAQVRRAYSARLSQNGSSLTIGDTRSKSALRRILDRLKTAILNLLSLAKTQRPVINYESLMSLSNSSRIDAIQTMDRLSRRLSSSSGLLRENRRFISSVSSSSSEKSRKRSSRQQPKQGHSTTASDARPNHTQTKVAVSDVPPTRKRPKPAHSRDRKVAAKGSGPSHGRSGSSETRSSTSSDTGPLRVPNRVSLVSMSSDSTKLGEISYRRSRLLPSLDSSSLGEYNVKPVYPLHQYHSPPKEKRGLLRRLFGSKETG
ncbi:hypothetical protein BJ170DRAFT_686773 [Xylariales sp. AK1849]|nr:hypothetical protein BJ170DRAFT_686773 [Xylariales sp. AK1849]